MKYLKQKTLSKFSPNDDALMVYDSRGDGHTANGTRAVIDLTGALRLPKGTDGQRPALTGVRTPAGPNGYIRYNTTTNVLEAYINSNWEIVRAGSGSTVVKQTIGPGDLVETKFGPLQKLGVSYTPPTLTSGGSPSTGVYDYPFIVLVENVMQISTTNYTVELNPAGTSSGTGYLAGASYPAGYYLSFTDPVPIGKYVTIYYGFAD